ncbi:unnamed protein product [Mycena citricolor]|uniref:RBR-type E3 ubiquitin transferase n=1 Tax=Mycena citricolor TaxID=2018698 RepID=A0AAD2K7Z9_9AGAR|nr:unnamed protein product [Mycena citricolor]
MKGTKCTFLHAAPAAAVARENEGAEVLNWRVGPALLGPNLTPDPDPSSSPHPPISNRTTSPSGSTHPDAISSDLTHETTERVLYNCSVTFGAGGSVTQVVTPFDACRIRVSGIPSLTDAEISAQIATVLANHGGAQLQIQWFGADAHPIAIADFTNPAAAAAAVGELERITFGEVEGGTNLVCALERTGAKLSVTGGAEERGFFRGRKVKLTWYGRRMSAFANYSSDATAKNKCEELHGKVYCGHTISATYRPIQAVARRIRGGMFSSVISVPSRSFTVMLRNLPMDVDERSLKCFCDADSVGFDPPRCPENVHYELMDVLERFGAVDTLDVLPMTKTSSKVSAFAQFHTEAGATAAEAGLRPNPPAFFGKSPFFIERTLSVKYNRIPATLFAKIRGPVDLLAGVYPEMIKYYLGEAEHSDPVVLVLHSTDSKRLAKVKSEVDRIVQGELLIQDGSKFWVPFFETQTGLQFIEDMYLHHGVFVRCDPRTRTARMFGSEEERARARKLIEQKVAKLKAQRHEIPLKRELIRILLRGDLKQLQTAVDPQQERLVLDVVALKIMLDGDAGHVGRLRTALNALDGTIAKDAGPILDLSCPVCLCDIEDAVQLDCGHAYCRTCIQHYIKPASGTEFTPRLCVAGSFSDGGKSIPCSHAIPYRTIRSLLDAGAEDELLLTSFLTHINTRPQQFQYCPSADCQMVYPIGIDSDEENAAIQCPSCLARICTTCKIEWHDDLTCAEHKDNLTGNTALLNQWRAEHEVKQCPNCHADIEKDGGCNHMQCVLCRTHICWICMETFRDGDGKLGIYPHLRRVHGGHGG